MVGKGLRLGSFLLVCSRICVRCPHHSLRASRRSSHSFTELTLAHLTRQKTLLHRKGKKTQKCVAQENQQVAVDEEETFRAGETKVPK